METPTATPTSRRFGANNRQQSALTLAKCDEKELLAELGEIKKADQKHVQLEIPEASATPKNSNGLYIRKSLILRDEKQTLNINCVYHIADDLYLLGCDQGLFSRKGEEGNTTIVRIEGMGAIYQMEFISSLNAVLFIEGMQERKKVLNIF